MTREEKLIDIQEHPERHKHSFQRLQECCTINGILDLSLMDCHPSCGTNGGVKCDVTKGPCACGAWH